MIDEEWLKELRFHSSLGFEVLDLEGLGSEKVVFKVRMDDDGRILAFKTFKNHLGYYIREIPPFISGKPLYELRQVVRKVSALAKNPLADLMFNPYDQLFQAILRRLYDLTTGRAPARSLEHELTSGMLFILQTPQMKRRLTEIASLPSEDEEGFPLTRINTPDFPIEDMRVTLSRWAQRALELLNELKPDAREPENLFQNHLLLFAGAAAEGFFADDVDEAVDLMEQRFGNVADHPKGHVLVGQVAIVADLLATHIRKPRVEAIVRYCARAHALFDVFGADGNVLARGEDYL